MRFVTLSYYHAKYGPRVLLSIPKEPASEIAEDLGRTLDFLESPGFFVQDKSKYKTVNWYFEISNEFARGGKDMLLLSVVLIQDDTDPAKLKTPMRKFVDELKAFKGLYRALCLDILETGPKEEIERIQNTQNEVKIMLKTFKALLPEEFPLILRVMKEEDLESIIEIDNLLLGDRRPNFWKRKIELLEKKSVIPPIIAEINQEIIGFVLGEASSWEYVVPENVGWIDTIGVNPAYQRKGVAGMLMDEMLKSMKKVGVTTVYTLIDWRDGDVLKFLDHMGFKRGDMLNLELDLDLNTIKYKSNNQSPVNIREMKEEDLERIIEIDHQLLGQNRADFWELKIDMLERQSMLPALVAEFNDNVIGFILGEASGWEYVVPENVGWIDTLGVDITYQRKGVAAMLVNEMLHRMKNLGVNKVSTLVNWRAWTLLQFFESIGFRRGDMINLQFQIENDKSE
ncbi:MAG: GNAT family N-acetyltransferase [Promethearchaeota archaeon]